MTYFADAYNDRLAQNNVVPLAGHAYQGNTYRSRGMRIEGSAVLIGRIPNRYEVFAGDYTDKP